MPSYDYDIGVIGGGAAGLTAASGAARAGARTILIEKEGRLGGDCLHYGCVPSKTLIKTAKVRRLMQRSHDFGLPRHDPQPVDFRMVKRRIQQVIDAIQEHDSVERFCDLGVKVEFGESAFSDDHLVRVDGSPVTARTWVVACGSSPAPPPVDALAQSACLTNRDIFYLDKLPEQLIILGAGPIGVEMAQAFCRLGSRVRVVQRSGRILTREDPELSDLLRAGLEKEGIVFHLNSRLKTIVEMGGYKEVHIEADGVGEIRLRGDAILAALGRTPNTIGLALENAGVETGPSGILVDKRLRTSQKHIYAAGDVIGPPQFTHTAGYEGGVVVTNAVFHLPRRIDYTLTPRCIYTDPELACVGHTEASARAEGLDYQVLVEDFSQNDRFLTEGGSFGRLKLILDPKGRPLGVQILGPGAGDLLSHWITVMGGNIKLSTLAAGVLPYPTLSEINKRAAGDYLAPRIFSEPVKKTLKYVFNFKGRACTNPGKG